ncbi:hypothetical protein ACJPQX_22705 [Vibrio vulnificus]|uniref:hypothetical protein n=1 Tax=Vibrio vulnificus TaxID=672 RepID=UPI0027F30E51|nr:hypothetical protein [Vibrio vulnificus]
MIFRIVNVLVLFGCVYWFATDASPEPVIVFLASIGTYFRDAVHGVIGSRFISLSSRNPLIRTFTNQKYSFISDTYISPAIIEDLNGWLSDTGGQVVAVNIADSNGSNRYFGDITVESVADGYPIVRFQDNEKTIVYQYVGCSFSGVHILRLTSNYGGSGSFNYLMLLTLTTDSSVDFERETKATSKDRLVVKKVGSISLGDRYNGHISYKWGFLHISPSDSMQCLKDKKEKVFVL